MVLIGRQLPLIPSVLDVDVDPPVGSISGERLGSSERLGAFGEYGSPTVLMFRLDRSPFACVVSGVSRVAEGPLPYRPSPPGRGTATGRCGRAASSLSPRPPDRGG
jgi:hypothetical protein